MSENKGWDYYTVRYLVGTIVGAGLVAFLTLPGNSPFSGQVSEIRELNEATYKDVGVFTAIGFAFCYLASAPILVFHAARPHLLDLSLTRLLLMAVSLAVISFGFSGVLPTYLTIPLIVVGGLQLYLLVCVVRTKADEIQYLYVSLARNRAKMHSEANHVGPQVREYVESYRHLREHGNAYLIVSLEVILAFLIANSPSKEFAVFVLLAWFVPSSAIWLLGSILEHRFAMNNQFK